MHFFARLLSIFIVSSFLFLVSGSSAHAEGEFQTDYKVNYTVDREGRTDIVQNITLKNKTANFYADKFELKIGSTKVDNVQAKDATGPMQTEVKFENNVTTISVKFNQRVIGIDKTLPWTLNYSTSELATKSGQIWEVSIPRVADSQDIGDYQASLTVPGTFGPVAFAVPNPKTQTSQVAIQEFTFDREQLTKSGIAISFGDRQVFSFDLNYYIENNNLTSQYFDVALPPDNNYQKVIIEKVDPPPDNVTVDEDGNFLARYKLSSKENLTIRVSGSTEVFSKPKRKLVNQLSVQQRSHYTQPQKFWETDNAFIKDKASKLKTPQEIYDFVTNYLSYNEQRLNQSKIERYGAAKASLNPKDAVCMEFTDLFIAIARSAGIPAREVEGYAYTQNTRLRPLSLAPSSGDLLHAWPEFWDDNLGWVQIDPTWGSTSGGLDYFNKLDFNHITFVQRGVSSTYPYPAGSYKKEGETEKKSVFVEFAQELPNPQSAAEIDIQLPKRAIAGVPIKAIVNVKNVGSSSIISANLNLDSGSIKNTSQNPVELAILPPYSEQEFSFNLQTKGFLTKESETIKLSLGDMQIERVIEIVPVYYLLYSPLFAVSIVISAVIIFLGFFLYRRYHKPKQGSIFSR
ncbi:MAG: transglutaminase domain-containing protein [Candidatus Curtissbacteria bacterium]|nr:transglutaminase domain-containing protein [Candidatus Curtissbacteria bacterium]